MIRKNKISDIPFENRSMIDPYLRAKVFKEIYEGYTKMYGIQLLYAFINSNPSSMVDYCIVYSAKNDYGTANLILFDVPPIYSARCTPAYQYLKERRQLKDRFFSPGIDEMCIMEKSKFYEYLQIRLELNRKKGDERYWKNPKNGVELAEGLLDISMLYKKKKTVE